VKSSTFTLLSVHAHPDDESSKGAPTVAYYASQGVDCVLVTATGGEEGDILNPAMDTPEVRANLGSVRAQELSDATKIIGYTQVELLGYRDSGMPDSEANASPDAFWNIPLKRSTDDLVRLIRRYRPDVMITYPEDQSGYPHPDHLRVHDISIAAFALAADPAYEPELGEAHTTYKLYYSTWSKRRMVAIFDRFIELGLEPPFPKERLDREGQDDLVTTSIEVRDFLAVRREALLAHRTQIDPNSPFWFALSVEDEASAYSTEDFCLAKVQGLNYEIPEGTVESDLFAGIAR
jgi:mycothiol S-conjugate amidase